MVKELLKKTYLYVLYAKYKHNRYQRHLQELSRTFLKEGEFVLKEFVNTLNDAKIVFWLDYGTLLGYHRENDFISHDTDIDTGAFIEDVDKIRSALENNGFRLVRYYKTLDGDGIEHCYKKNGCSTTIDVFLYRKNPNTVMCYSFYPLPNLNIKKNLFKEIPFTTYTCTMPFSGLKKTVFKGLNVYVPIDIDGYLMANYGPNYMTPDPHYSSSVATNIKKFTYEEKPAVGYLEIPY